MKLFFTKSEQARLRPLVVFWLLFCVLTGSLVAQAPVGSPEPVRQLPWKEQSLEDLMPAAQSIFRIDKVAVAGGSEIITIFARRTVLKADELGPVNEIPLISILRDTLGDDIPE